jgi:hypothetical protein
MSMRSIATAILALAVATPCAAQSCNLDDMVGYTLIARKTIEGRIDNGRRSDDFEGCDFDRIIAFGDNTGVRCTSYSYSYAYRPTAYIWSRGYELRMCVNENEYPIGPLR